MGDWLGTGRVADQLRQYRSFEEARKYVWTLNLRNWKEWKEFSRAKGFPKDIPMHPNNTYKDKGWVHMRDWLGIERFQSRVYRPFKEAREFARSLNLNSFKEWNEYTKREDFPEDIPKNHIPRFYKGQYNDLADFLGYKK